MRQSLPVCWWSENQKSRFPKTKHFLFQFLFDQQTFTFLTSNSFWQSKLLPFRFNLLLLLFMWNSIVYYFIKTIGYCFQRYIGHYNIDLMECCLFVWNNFFNRKCGESLYHSWLQIKIGFYPTNSKWQIINILVKASLKGNIFKKAGRKNAFKEIKIYTYATITNQDVVK